MEQLSRYHNHTMHSVPGRGEAVNTKCSGCLVSGNLSYEQKNSQIQS